MKLVVLAFLLLLAVASIVSGSPAQRGTVADDAPDASVVSGDPNESGKSRYGDKTCLPVILQTPQLYKIVSLLNYKVRHGVWKNSGEIPGDLVRAL